MNPIDIMVLFSILLGPFFYHHEIADLSILKGNDNFSFSCSHSIDRDCSSDFCLICKIKRWLYTARPL
jgi:hypothetical protein